MLTSKRKNIPLQNINIPDSFSQSLPSSDKISRQYKSYKKTGGFNREILVDADNNLIDGYTVYLVCKMLGIENVDVLQIKVKEKIKEPSPLLDFHHIWLSTKLCVPSHSDTYFVRCNDDDYKPAFYNAFTNSWFDVFDVNASTSKTIDTSKAIDNVTHWSELNKEEQ